jgi:TM2 domain-containing membrane protein YozV
MLNLRILLPLFVLLCSFPSLAGKHLTDTVWVQMLTTQQVEIVQASGPGPIVKLLHKKEKLNRKATAAILAFPFPFGIVGLHRIYLGCAPYIPIVYIGSLGGIFGIMPLIDFIVIVSADDINTYANSNKVFMWVQ